MVETAAVILGAAAALMKKRRKTVGAKEAIVETVIGSLASAMASETQAVVRVMKSATVVTNQVQQASVVLK